MATSFVMRHRRLMRRYAFQPPGAKRDPGNASHVFTVYAGVPATTGQIHVAHIS
jgi:hypothetical protein